MMKNWKNPEKAVQYLLGELSEAERDALEEQIFTDEQLSLLLDATENDLIDEYVRGEMDPVRHRKFELNYLISERRREKVRAAGILHEQVFTEKESPLPAVAAPSPWQTLAEFFRPANLAWAGSLAVILFLLLLSGWLIFRSGESADNLARNSNSGEEVQLPSPEPTRPDDQHPPVNGVQTGRNAPSPNSNRGLPVKKPAPPVDELRKPPKTARPPAPRVFAFTLLPPMRSGERPTVVVPPGTETIRLRVVHNNEQTFIKYRAEIRDQNGDLIWSREIPVSGKTLSQPLVLNVRGGALASGAYELTLSGITADSRLEEIKFYNFTVEKK